MKKIRVLCFVLVALMLATLVFASCNDDRDRLVVYNWADYIYDQDQMKEDFDEYYFQQTGRHVNVTYVTFDTNETMLTKVINGDSKIDVMCPSEYAIQKLLEANKLKKLDYFGAATEFNQNSQYIDMDLVHKFSDAFSDLDKEITEYFVPYMTGTLGILYNKEFEAEVKSAGWGALFNKDLSGNKLSDELTKKILMKDSIRDSYAATVFYLLESGQLSEPYASMPIGELINCTDTQLVTLVEGALTAQKSELLGYEVDMGKEDMSAGRAYVSLAWSGDAMYAMYLAEEDYGIELDYFVPSIAGNIWFDGWVIPEGAENEEAARYFIDFLNSPEIAAQNMATIDYTSAVSPAAFLNPANSDALEILMDAYDFETEQDIIDNFFNDPRRYADINDVTLGVMRDFGAANQKIVLMWESVRAGGIETWQLILIIVGGLAVVAGVVAAVVFLKGKSKRRVKVN